MYSILLFVIVTVISVIVEGEPIPKDDPWERYTEYLRGLNEDHHLRFGEEFPFPDCSKYNNKFEFTCEIERSEEPPTSAHKVRPGDIDVIGAVGDSLTAANGAGACFLPAVIRQYRGVSWSAGGNDEYEEALTLPNILKKFNPQLRGYSTGYGNVNSKGSHFNCAVPAARSEKMPEQTGNLIDRLRSSTEIDFEKDWKLITLFVGGNDLCQYCKDRERSKAENYVSRIRDALDMMMDQLPRTIVNVVGVMRVPEIVSLVSVKCNLIHSILCPCSTDITPEEEFEFVELTLEYQVLLEALILSGRYDKREDFTVVYQPFLTETDLPKDEFGEPDKTYFAPDCFHLGIKGHAIAAKELWNNMMEPVGSKRTNWDFDEPLLCPTKDYPYIFTNNNSVPQTLKSPLKSSKKDSISEKLLKILN